MTTRQHTHQLAGPHGVGTVYLASNESPSVWVRGRKGELTTLRVATFDFLDLSSLDYSSSRWSRSHSRRCSRSSSSSRRNRQRLCVPLRGEFRPDAPLT